MSIIKYKDCIEIHTRICAAFIIEYEDKTKQIILYDSKVKITDIVKFIKVRTNKKFTVGIIDVGLFNLDDKNPIDHSYSSDGRKVNEKMEMVI